jgi:hypothetical protein
MTTPIANNWPLPERPHNRDVARAATMAQLAEAATFLAGRRRCALPASLRRRLIVEGPHTYRPRVPLGPLDYRLVVELRLDSSWTEFVELQVEAVTTYDPSVRPSSSAPASG